MTHPTTAEKMSSGEAQAEDSASVAADVHESARGMTVGSMADLGPTGAATRTECCARLSAQLISTLLDKLPAAPALVLSIGSGLGLLEELLLQQSRDKLNLYGVEVDACANKFLRAERLLRVPTVHSLHADAILAEALLFVYPRDIGLIERYAREFVRGVLQTVIWIGPIDEYPEVERVLQLAFVSVEIIGPPVVPGYERVAVASDPREAQARQ